MTFETMIAALVGIAFLAYVLWPTPRVKPKRRRRESQARQARPRQKADAPVPANAIVLDGSNIMFWGGDPSAEMIKRVIAELRQRDLSPIAIFDASAGYQISDKFMGEAALSQAIGLPPEHVYVVHKGVVADEVILDFAAEHDLRVVSNDRYRDWSVQFPLVRQKGRLIKGRWKEGSVILQGL